MNRATAALAATLVLTAGCTTPGPAVATPSADPGGQGTTAASPGPAALAIAALTALPVKGRAPRTGYTRTQFGAAWADVDANTCSTREDVLRRDLTDTTVAADGCTILNGTLEDPYSTATINFTRGPTTSEAVQIDHVVALSNAWQTGAQQLDTTTRTAFANDPLNLLATDGRLNQQKSDGDAATWLPPDRTAHCDYVARQIAVKTIYHLWVTAPENDAMSTVLGTCPTQTLPTHADTATGAGPVPAAAADPGQPYRRCADARAAGATPLRKDDPRYSAALDGDGDGVACE